MELTPPIPVPIALPVTSRSVRYRRAARTLRVVGRQLAPLLARAGLRRKPSEADLARALRLAFEELGATYVKFGQLMGSAPGVFGEAFSDEFRSCLDTGPPLPFAVVSWLVEQDLGRPISTVFASFEREPLAAASIAVVHRATTADGQQVAVKVLRPDIEEVISADLDLMEPLFAFLSRRVGVPQAGPMVQLLGAFRLQVAEELDLRNERQFMVHYQHLLDQVDLPLLTVPETYEALSGRRVLTMEFLDGVPVDDFAAIAEAGLDARQMVEAALEGWMLTAIRNGFFHGDVHAGNFLLLRDGRLGIIDWGIVGRLDADTHDMFRRVIEAALGEEAAWEEVARHLNRMYGGAFQDALGFSDDDMVAFFRNQMEPIMTQPFGEVSLAGILAGPFDPPEPGSPRKPLRERLKEMAQMRRFSRQVNDNGASGTTFDLSTFLLQKQLLYFERYGKLYLSDRALLDNPAFYRAALAAPPIGKLPAATG